MNSNDAKRIERAIRDTNYLNSRQGIKENVFGEAVKIAAISGSAGAGFGALIGLAIRKLFTKTKKS